MVHFSNIKENNRFILNFFFLCFIIPDVYPSYDYDIGDKRYGFYFNGKRLLSTPLNNIKTI